MQNQAIQNHFKQQLRKQHGLQPDFRLQKRASHPLGWLHLHSSYTHLSSRLKEKLAQSIFPSFRKQALPSFQPLDWNTYNQQVFKERAHELKHRYSKKVRGSMNWNSLALMSMVIRLDRHQDVKRASLIKKFGQGNNLKQQQFQFLVRSKYQLIEPQKNQLRNMIKHKQNLDQAEKIVSWEILEEVQSKRNNIYQARKKFADQQQLNTKSRPKPEKKNKIFQRALPVFLTYKSKNPEDSFWSPSTTIFQQKQVKRRSKSEITQKLFSNGPNLDPELARMQCRRRKSRILTKKSMLTVSGLND